MRGQAMKNILADFKERGIPVETFDALDVFAREGDWQTVVYTDKVKSIEAWEIDEQFLPALKKNLPQAKIRITNSIEEIKKPEHFGQFDMIVVDNPLSCFGENREYCEHFDVLPDVCKLLKDEAILIFDINKEPYNFAQFEDWQQRRQQFYGLEDTSKISVEWLLNFYTEMFQKNGYQIEWSYNMSRGDFEHNDYFHYLVYKLKRNS